MDLAIESSQHNLLSINKDKEVTAALRVLARERAMQFSSILRPLTHRLLHKSSKDAEAEHLRIPTKITYDSLRLARELQARKDSQEYIWPHHGEQFNPELHVHVEDVDADPASRAKRGRERKGKREVIIFTLMCGVESAVVITTAP